MACPQAQELHNLFAKVGFASGVLAAAGFLLLLMWENDPVPAIGLRERLATAALAIWLIVFSRRFLQSAGASRT
jgi:hypothetical protein